MNDLSKSTKNNKNNNKIRQFILANAQQKYFLECKFCKTLIYYCSQKYFQFVPQKQITINQLFAVNIEIQQKKQKRLLSNEPSVFIQSQNRLLVFCKTCATRNKVIYFGQIKAKQVLLSNNTILYVFQKSNKNLLQTRIITGCKFKYKKDTKNQEIDNLATLVKQYTPINMKRVRLELIRLLLYWQRLLICKIVQAQRIIDINEFYQTRMSSFKRFYQAVNQNKIKRKRDSLTSKTREQLKELEI